MKEQIRTNLTAKLISRLLLTSVGSVWLNTLSYGQLSGIKTINPNGSGANNYTSFTAAINALKVAGVSGSVTFNVSPGIYTERVTIDAAATLGASSTNQIIFRKDPASPSGNLVIMRPLTAGESVLNVYMASWLTIDGINLEDGDGGNGTKYTNRGIQLSGAQRCTFKNFTIRMNSRGKTTNPVSRGITSSTTLANATRPLSYNTFDNLRIVSVSNRAFSLFSDFTNSANNADLHDRGNVVTNCRIDSVGGGATGPTCLVGFFLEQDSLYFANNIIQNINHTPYTRSDLNVIQVGSNPNNPNTRWVRVENNTVVGGTANIVEGYFNGLALYRTTGALVRNNSIGTVTASISNGIYSAYNNDADIYGNTISQLTTNVGDAKGIVSGTSDYGVKIYDNTVSGITTNSASTVAIGIESQDCIDSKIYSNKVSDIYIGINSNQTASAIGIRTAAAMATMTTLPDGGNVYVYDNFISNIYAANPNVLDSGYPILFGIRSNNLIDINTQNLISGGTQHIYNNTIVMNRPSSLTSNITHAFAGMYLYSSDFDDVDAIFVKNNIIKNLNTYAAGSTVTSYLMAYLGGATNTTIEANNYNGYDMTNTYLGMYYDAATTQNVLYPSLTSWRTAGLDGTVGSSDSTAVTFTSISSNDLHLSSYTKPSLYKNRVAPVLFDIDGVSRLAVTQAGADAFTTENTMSAVNVTATNCNTLTVSNPVANTTYLWNTGQTGTSISVTQTGNYNAVALNTLGALVGISNIVPIVSNLITPTITASGSVTLCQGESVTLTSSGTGSVLWSNGATTNSINVTSAGSYTVSTISGGCTSAVSAPVTVVVNPVPVSPTISVTGATTFCQGGSVTLTASVGTGSVLWSNGATTNSINVTSAGSYMVSRISNGCTSAVSAATTVTVKQSSASTLSQSICAGSNFVFGNQTLTQAGTYIATLTNAAGCDSVVTLNLTVQSLAASFSHTSNTLQASPSEAISYQWLLNGQPISGATGQQYVIGQSGNYSVIVVSGVCTDTSAVQQLQATSIKGKLNVNTIGVYPNPSTGLVTVDLGDISSANYELINSVGQQIETGKLGKVTILNLSEVAAGVYVLKVSTAGEQITKQISLLK